MALPNSPFASPFSRFSGYHNPFTTNNFNAYNISNTTGFNPNYRYSQNINNSSDKIADTKDISNNSEKNSRNTSEKKEPETPDFFEILGIKLHFDDILIICLIFFLYKEEVHDEMLFIALILLLLS